MRPPDSARRHGESHGTSREDTPSLRGKEQGVRQMRHAQIKALTFDVFGTVVDWRGTIVREGARLNAAKGLDVDWARFADAWRAQYGPSMERVRRGELPWTGLDTLHRMSL